MQSDDEITRQITVPKKRPRHRMKIRVTIPPVLLCPEEAEKLMDGEYEGEIGQKILETEEPEMVFPFIDCDPKGGNE